ncbi:MAG: GAF domain-containing protein [Thiotrichaceae bacterium]|nr:GAF domain-containing protein [Thiotrichaceae bacterium]
MKIQVLTQKLHELKEKQQRIEAAWRKTGNREFLEFMVELLPKALDAERCSIFINNPDDNNVWIQCGTGLQEKQISVPKDSSVVGKVIASGKIIMENNLANQIGAHDTIAFKTGFTAKSTICVPVLGAKTRQIAGAIQVLNKLNAESAFTQDDIAIVKKLAHHIQVNIENIYQRQEMANIAEEIGKKVSLIEAKLKSLGHTE